MFFFSTRLPCRLPPLREGGTKLCTRSVPSASRGNPKEQGVLVYPCFYELLLGGHRIIKGAHLGNYLVQRVLHQPFRARFAQARNNLAHLAFVQNGLDCVPAFIAQRR